MADQLNHIYRRLAMIMLATAGLFLVNFNALQAQSSSTDKEVTSDDTAQVVLTEFSDYECPACGYYHPWIKQLKKDFGEDLKIDHHHYPLSQHRFSALAARAAEAARNQGKFTEMHNLIFEHQDQWSRGNAQQIFIGYADELGLDMKQFKKDLNSEEIYKRVQKDKQMGRDRGVNSTPTFYINGDKIQNPRSYQSFKSMIQQVVQQTKSK